MAGAGESHVCAKRGREKKPEEEVGAERQGQVRGGWVGGVDTERTVRRAGAVR